MVLGGIGKLGDNREVFSDTIEELEVFICLGKLLHV